MRYSSDKSRTDEWKLLHISLSLFFSSASTSTSCSVFTATASSASSGHSLNQSMVQQLTSDGNWRRRSRKASPIGEKHSTTCRLARHVLMKYCQSCVGSSSGPPSGAVTPAFLAATRHVSITAARSSYGNRFGTSPELSRLLMSSTYDSSLICESENKNTHGLPLAPASRQNRFRSSFHSTRVYDLEMAIWKQGMPMMNDASRLSD